MGSEEKDLKDIQKPSAGKKVAIGCGIAVGALLVIYVGLGVFFQSHFYFRSTVNGVNSSAASLKTVKSRIKDQAAGYQLTITEADGSTETITSQEVGLDVDLSNGNIDQLLSDQNGFLWVTSVFVPAEYVSDSIVFLDDNKLNHTVSDLNCVNNKKAVKTENATYELKKGTFYVKDEVYGTEVDKKALTSNLKDALISLQDTMDLTETKSYVQPTVLSDNKELNGLIDRLNDITQINFVYTIGSKKVNLTSDEIASWLQIDEDLEIAFDEEAMSEYIADLASDVDTVGTTRTLHTQTGTDVTVAPGNYGWKVDREGELAQLEEDLKAGKDVSRDLVYSATANSHDGNDYGDTYVEVDLSSQHVWLVKNGSVIVSSDCVSGDVSRNRLTPVGAYRIMYCQRDAILRGENYRTPVKYWMPFWNGCGLHDATWRGAFGGDIYLTDGSHGCVNLPLSAVRSIFENVEAGYPVLVYGGYTSMPMSEEEAQSLYQQTVDAINAIGDPNAVTADYYQMIADAWFLYNYLPSGYRANVPNAANLTQAMAVYRANINPKAFY